MQWLAGLMSAGWPGVSEVGQTTIAEHKHSSASTDSSSPRPVQICFGGTAPAQLEKLGMLTELVQSLASAGLQKASRKYSKTKKQNDVAVRQAAAHCLVCVTVSLPPGCYLCALHQAGAGPVTMAKPAESALRNSYRDCSSSQTESMRCCRVAALPWGSTLAPLQILRMSLCKASLHMHVSTGTSWTAPPLCSAPQISDTCCLTLSRLLGDAAQAAAQNA